MLLRRSSCSSLELELARVVRPWPRRSHVAGTQLHSPCHRGGSRWAAAIAAAPVARPAAAAAGSVREAADGRLWGWLLVPGSPNCRQVSRRERLPCILSQGLLVQGVGGPGTTQARHAAAAAACRGGPIRLSRPSLLLGHPACQLLLLLWLRPLGSSCLRGRLLVRLLMVLLSAWGVRESLARGHRPSAGRVAPRPPALQIVSGRGALRRAVPAALRGRLPVVLWPLAMPLGQLLLPGHAAPCGVVRLVRGLVMGAQHLPSSRERCLYWARLLVLTSRGWAA